MKTFKYNINGRELCIRVSGEDSTISDILPAYAAVISLALLENDIEVVHDDESDVITLQHHRSLWGNPVSLLRPVVGGSSCSDDVAVPTSEVF